MLVQFKVKNFLSFKDETILDMSAIPAYKEHEDNLIDLVKANEKILKVASIYGSNASGKSNLIIAFSAFKKIIADSFNNVKDGEKTALEQHYQPFAFVDDKENIEMEIILIIDEQQYNYGFIYNDKLICYEWLYIKKFDTKRTITIFEREFDKVVFGNQKLRNECKDFAEKIDESTLVLSFFNKLKLNVPIFNTLYNKITAIFISDPDFFFSDFFIMNHFKNFIDIDKELLLDFLKIIDTDIVDIEYEKNDDKIKYYTIHLDQQQNPHKLDLFLESKGTIRSIGLFGFIHIMLKYNCVMIVDELETSLHPLLMKHLIDLFYQKNTNAQLIYTTHNTTLLNKRFVRRDQVWFMEKKNNQSILYPLSDFKPRNDSSFEKDYLAGLYGGIPFLHHKSIKDI